MPPLPVLRWCVEQAASQRLAISLSRKLRGACHRISCVRLSFVYRVRFASLAANTRKYKLWLTADCVVDSIYYKPNSEWVERAYWMMDRLNYVGRRRTEANYRTFSRRLEEGQRG